MSPSASQVKRAGRTLRRFLRGEEHDAAAFNAAYGILVEFRAQHQMPLTTANMGVRSMVRTVRCDGPEISQRLKRVPTILDKLTREPTLDLSTMQDIGGCRAVLRSIDEVRLVQARLVARGRVERVSDYIEAPRSSGYRGVHVIVRYHDRRIEVQLRTQVMHAWAVTVEALSGVISADVKSGRGPKEVIDLMSAISEAMALEELGQRVDEELDGEIARLRVSAQPFLLGGPR